MLYNIFLITLITGSAIYFTYRGMRLTQQINRASTLSSVEFHAEKSSPLAFPKNSSNEIKEINYKELRDFLEISERLEKSYSNNLTKFMAAK